jgi:biopolymer transport protein ExbB
MDWLKILIDYGVIGLLVFMSIVGLGLTIERFMVYRRVRVEDFQDRKRLELALTHKLHLIATIGSNAPYVGLLGTVMGIMLTFYTMGRDGMTDANKIMVGLALALKVTAGGLVVAIPAVVCYNLLLRRVKVLLIEWDIHHG